MLLTLGRGDGEPVARALSNAGAIVEHGPAALREASGVVIAGEGHLSDGLGALAEAAAVRQLERRLAGGCPVLGIGLGLHALIGHDDAPGLPQWPGEVEPLRAGATRHTGWARLRGGADSPLLTGIPRPEFYFDHTHAVHDDPAEHHDPESPLRPPAVTWAEHPVNFVAMIENGPLSALQFHPEKSGEAGTQLLRNWLATLR